MHYYTTGYMHKLALLLSFGNILAVKGCHWYVFAAFIQVHVCIVHVVVFTCMWCMWLCAMHQCCYTIVLL